MPYIYEGPRTYYPKGVYQKPEQTATAVWLTGANDNILSNCMVKQIQSINAFNSFYPMEVIATAAETATIIEKHKDQHIYCFSRKQEQFHSYEV